MAGKAPNVLLAGNALPETERLIEELRQDGCLGRVGHVDDPAALGAALGQGRWDAIIVESEAAGVKPAGILDAVSTRRIDTEVFVLSHSAGNAGDTGAIVAERWRRGAGGATERQAGGALREVLARLDRRRAPPKPGSNGHLLEQMFDTIHLAIAILDPEFNFIRVNRAYALAGKHEPEWFAGRNHFELYPDAENEAIFRRVVETGTPFTALAKPFVYPDQPERGMTYWDWTLQPHWGRRGRAGAVTGLILSLVEVTARERAIEAAEAGHRRLYSILDRLPGFVSIVSPAEHGVRFLNHASQELLGDPAGRACHEVFTGSKEPCSICESQLVLDEGQPRDWERASAAGRVYHVWGIPFSEPGRGDLVLQFGMDMTMRRELEKRVLRIAATERQKVGQDLQDSLGQTLTGASMLGKALTQRLTAAGSAESQAAADISVLLVRAIQQVRALARGLCPVELGQWGLQEALSRLADETARAFGVSCLFHSCDDLVVEENAVAAQLYQVAQGAVSYALTHGSPRRIVILLRSTDAGLTLTIEDDGAAPIDAGASMGLRMMKHCASLIGAILDVRRHPEGGTAVTCTLPGWPAAARVEEHPNAKEET